MASVSTLSFLKSRLYVKSRFVKSRLYCKGSPFVITRFHCTYSNSTRIFVDTSLIFSAGDYLFSSLSISYQFREFTCLLWAPKRGQKKVFAANKGGAIEDGRTLSVSEKVKHFQPIGVNPFRSSHGKTMTSFSYFGQSEFPSPSTLISSPINNHLQYSQCCIRSQYSRKVY